MNLIACVDQNWGIGYQGQLLYHYKEDMLFFKNQTIYNVVIMGKNTFLSLPNQQPLENRHNVVLTSDKTFNPKDVVVLHSLEELFFFLKDMIQKTSYTLDDIFIIGGGQVYKELLPYCSTAYITMVKKNAQACDTYFPNLDKEQNWVCKRIQKIPEKPLWFYTYENREVKNIL